MRFKFRKDESIQAILYILEKFSGKTEVCRICKTLYYADQLHLSRYARTITGDTYIATQQGVVPSNIGSALNIILCNNKFADDDFKEHFDLCNDNYLQALHSTDTNYLSESDVECLNSSIYRCKDMAINELIKLPQDITFNEAIIDKEISYKEILSEIGENKDYIEYLHQKMLMENETFT